MNSTSKSDNILVRQLAEAQEKVVVGGLYAHYKDPENKRYTVVALALDEATESPRVVYRALYGDGLTWIRTVEDLTATVQTPTGEQPRFALISAAA